MGTAARHHAVVRKRARPAHAPTPDREGREEEHEYVTGNVVVLKDEVEGLPGRLVYER